MADVVLDVQTGAAASSVPSGAVALFVDSTNFYTYTKDTTGIYRGRSIGTGATASQGPSFSSDTYVTGSNVLIPSFGTQARTKVRWTISVSKTAAGVATPVFTIRVGAAGTTADTARVTLTGPAQTAAADVGVFEIIMTVRSVSASGVLQATMWLSHNGAAAGLAANDGHVVEAASAGFDNQNLGGQVFGISINAGASAAWTITQVVTEMDYN